MVDLCSGLGVLACQLNFAQKCEANQDLKRSDGKLQDINCFGCHFQFSVRSYEKALVAWLRNVSLILTSMIRAAHRI